MLRPLISPNNSIMANPGNNSLVITDYADNLRRLSKIIAALDAPVAADVDVIPIRYAHRQRHGRDGQQADGAGAPAATPAACRWWPTRAPIR